MAGAAPDPFAALGLTRDASASDIKERYRELARRYHPSRHQQLESSDDSKALLTALFHNVQQAWECLRTDEFRRRCTEIMGLFETQENLLVHHADLLNAEQLKVEDHHAVDQRTSPSKPVSEHSTVAKLDGYVSSDAEDDHSHRPPSTAQNRHIRHRDYVSQRSHRHFGASLLTPTDAFNDVPVPGPDGLTYTEKPPNKPRKDDYFTERRKKLAKVRKRELHAFYRYRDAMVAKLEAEKEADMQRELYEKARSEREEVERAPKKTQERVRFFHQIIAVAHALSHAPPKRAVRSDTGFGLLSPVSAAGEQQNWLAPDPAGLVRRSSHRRAWSNDNSGDQNSSDEDDERHSPMRRPSPPHFGSFTFDEPPHNTLHDAIRDPRDSTSRPVQDSLPLLPPAAPFKMFVRQPSIPHADHQQCTDSGDETPSGSSRSPSPLSDSANYTVLPPRGFAGVFNTDRGRRSRSPSPNRQNITPTLVSTSNEIPGIITKELGQLTCKHIEDVEFSVVPVDNVHRLTYQEKCWTLGEELECDVAPPLLLQALARLNNHVADKFMVKADIKENFHFRLIYSDSGVDFLNSKATFIALSYRRRLHVEKDASRYTLPLEADIFQAVLEERKSSHEGLWVDQICIAQDSNDERTISMSAMDMVYRCARLIVVALDDIMLNGYEGELLQNYMAEYNSLTHVQSRQRLRHKQPPYLETNEDLFRAVRKILRSSWFQRAWCRHEMRLAKEHVFLVPCEGLNGKEGRSILRFDTWWMAHILALSSEVPFEPDVETVKPALYAFFRERSRMQSGKTSLRSHHGNFSTVVAEVFAMQAGGDPNILEEQRESDARKDKISIILNTMECGLTLHPNFRKASVHITQEDCFHDLLLLALAAQDPGALCSVGPPLCASKTAASWLHLPTVSDSGLNNARTLPKLPASALTAIRTSDIEGCIQLDVKFLIPEPSAIITPDPDWLELARRFIHVCVEKKWGRNRKRYIIHDTHFNSLFGIMSEIYAQTLACIIHCGSHWMGEVCERFNMSRWKIDLEGAQRLLVALKSTCGRWPVEAWRSQDAAFIIDFVNFLIIRGMPQRQLIAPEPWRPMLVETSVGGTVLTFVPIDKPDAVLAVPDVLTGIPYMHLARIWVLEPRHAKPYDVRGNGSARRSSLHDGIRSEDLDHLEWTLLGKSVVFSDEVSTEHMSNPARVESTLRKQQKVFGRRAPGFCKDGYKRAM